MFPVLREEWESTVAQRTQRMLAEHFFEQLWGKEKVPLLLFSHYPEVRAATQWFTHFSIKKSHDHCSRGFPPCSYGCESAAAHNAGQRYLQFLIIYQVQLQQELNSLTSAQHSGRLGMLYFRPNLYNYQIFAWACKLGITRCHLWTGIVTELCCPAGLWDFSIISASCQIFECDLEKKWCATKAPLLWPAFLLKPLFFFLKKTSTLQRKCKLLFSLWPFIK